MTPTNGNSGAMADYTVDNMPEWYSWKFHITNLIINDGVIKIGDYAFYQAANLADITLGQNLNAIGNDAFSGCTGLESISIEAVNPPVLGVYNPFNQVPENIPVYVPCESIADYQAAEGWSDFSNIVDPCATVTQTIELVEGWNSISLFIEVDDPVAMLAMLKEGLGENALTIEGSEGYTEFDGEEWFGDLDELGITNEQSYMINVLNSCTVELQGMPANPTDYEISISQGWNRIGFPSAEELEVAVALSEFAAEEGDMLEGPDGYTEFDGEEWFGDIEMMEPGMGYQYFSNSDEVKTLVFRTGRSKARTKAVFFGEKKSRRKAKLQD